MPSLQGVTVSWPDRYSWAPGAWRAGLIRNELDRMVRVEEYDVSARRMAWHDHGGFPVPEEERRLLGQPGHPTDAHDIRGEVFEVRADGGVIRCAYDYSDYTMVSREVLEQVDLYFKCLPPGDLASEKVIAVGFFPRDRRLLARARRAMFRDPSARNIDVYGRFGAWTDSQPIRELLVTRLRDSGLSFTGGFDTRIYPEYLQELMRSKVAVDAPGQAAISYRFVEAMALGAVVVARKPSPAFPEPLVDGVHYVAMEDDCSNVAESCEELLSDPGRRSSIQSSAHGFFDRNFSPQSGARRILAQALALTRSS